MINAPIGMIEIQFKREVNTPTLGRIQLAQVYAPNGMLARTYCYNNAGVLEGHVSYHYATNKNTLIHCSVGSPKNPESVKMPAPAYLTKIAALAEFHLPVPVSLA